MDDSTDSTLPRTVSRHDLVLAAIPAAFLASVLASWALAVPSRLALTAAGVVAAAVMADGLFRNPPRTGASGP